MLGLFLASKINFFHSFFEVPIFYRFWNVLERFWEGLGRVWGGFTRFGPAFDTLRTAFFTACSLSGALPCKFFTTLRMSFHFSADFRGARLFLTSKSSSSRFFALDVQIFRSVRRLGLIFRFFTVRTSTCGGKARVMEIPGGALPPGSLSRNFLGGLRPPRSPPRQHFKKFALPGKFFEMIKCLHSQEQSFRISH